MRRLIALLSAFVLTGSAFALNLYGDVGVEFAPAVNGSYVQAEACTTLGFRGDIGQGFFPDATYQAEVLTCYDAIDNAAHVQLGKTVLTAFFDAIDLHVGNQTMSWGSMNIFAPIDVVNAKNLSYPLTDPQAAKLPSPTVKVNYFGDGFDAEVFVIPVYRKMLTPKSLWPAPMPELGDPPAGGFWVFDPSDVANLDLGGADSALADLFVQEHVPEFSLANTQFGARIGIPVNVLDGADLNVSYYRGFRHEPHVSFSPVQLTGSVADIVIGIIDELPLTEAEKQQLLALLNDPELQQSLYLPLPELHYTPINAFGVDFSAVTGSWVLRGEAAFELSEDSDGSNPALGNNRFSVAFGAETMLPGNAVVFGEVLYSHLFPDKGQDNAVQSVQTGFGGNYEITNRLTVQGAWLHEWTSGGGVLQPSVTYQIADGLNAHANLAVFYGPAHTQYGAWSKQSHINVGLTYSF